MDNQRYTTVEDEQIPSEVLFPKQGRTTHRYRRSARISQNCRIVWKYRRAFLMQFAVAVVVSTVLIMLIPKHYKATATLMPPDSNSLSILGLLMGSSDTDNSGSGGAGSSGAASAGNAVGSLLGLNSARQLYVHAAESRTVADQLIQRFNLMQVYDDTYIEDGRKDLEASREV